MRWLLVPAALLVALALGVALGAWVLPPAAPSPAGSGNGATSAVQQVRAGIPFALTDTSGAHLWCVSDSSGLALLPWLTLPPTPTPPGGPPPSSGATTNPNPAGYGPGGGY